MAAFSSLVNAAHSRGENDRGLVSVVVVLGVAVGVVACGAAVGVVVVNAARRVVRPSGANPRNSRDMRFESCFWIFFSIASGVAPAKRSEQRRRFLTTIFSALSGV